MSTVIVECGSCGDRQSQEVEPGRTLITHWRRCARCGAVGGFKVIAALGLSELLPPPEVAGHRQIRIAGIEATMPRCCAYPSYYLEAHDDTFHCRRCRESWPMQELRRLALGDAEAAELEEASAARRAAADANVEALAHADQIVASIADVMHLGEAQGIPVIEGSVIGYRAWSFNVSDWLLHGTGNSAVWVPGDVHEAECRPFTRRSDLTRRPAHKAPDPDCDCGLYALARFQEKTRWWDSSRTEIVVGAVEAWADVDEMGLDRMVIHPSGFRSQYMRIVLLSVDDAWPRAKRAAVRALASEYGADVCKFAHLADAASEHGQLVPSDLLHWAAGGVWPGPRTEPDERAVGAVEAAARLRAAYDQLMDEWRAGRLSAFEARDALAPVARQLRQLNPEV